jgi:hypothetical protein
MKQKSLLLLLVVLTYPLFTIATNSYEQRAIADLKKIINYTKLNASDSADFVLQRIQQLKQQDELQIPKRFHIPAELMSYRLEGKSNYYIRYNTGKNTSVGFVPSDLVIYYESEAWTDYQINGNNSPMLSIILAQQFTESGFNPAENGDGGNSVGLPQLYLPTAQWLMKIDANKWNNYFYIDKSGKQHFNNVRSQVRFPYDFLPKYKKYSADNKFEGLRRYNGSGSKANYYARLVLKRSIVYLDLMQQYNYFEEDTSNLLDKIAYIINMGLVIKGENQLSKKEIEEIANDVKQEFSRNWNFVNNNQLVNINSLEGKENKLDLSENYMVPNDGRNYYIVIEEGRSLFSYFHKTDEMLATINNPSNSEYYCYYWNKGKEVKVSNKEQLGTNALYTNAHTGSVINIPPGTKIYSEDASIITEINN